MDPTDARKVAVAMALGGIAGAAIIQSHHDQKRKSQAEKDLAKEYLRTEQLFIIALLFGGRDSP